MVANHVQQHLHRPSICRTNQSIGFWIVLTFAIPRPFEGFEFSLQVCRKNHESGAIGASTAHNKRNRCGHKLEGGRGPGIPSLAVCTSNSGNRSFPLLTSFDATLLLVHFLGRSCALSSREGALESSWCVRVLCVFIVPATIRAPSYSYSHVLFCPSASPHRYSGL